MAQSTSIKLTDGLKDRIKAIADIRQRSVNRVMNEALLEYVGRAEKRAAFLRDAEQAHRDYLETGLHVTAEEMDAWFDKVAKGEDPPLLEPHR